MSRDRLFQLSGIAFVALAVLAVVGIGGSTPGDHASGAELARFYDDNAVRQSIGAFVLAAAAPFVVLFGIWLARSLGSRREGGLSSWGYVLVSGTVLVAGSVLMAAFLHFALSSGGDDKISPTALEALNTLDANTWVAFNPALGVMMLGAAGVLLSSGLARWLGWVALVLGVAAFVPFADFFALLGTLVWIVVASFVLGRGEAAAAVRASAAA